MVCVCGGVRSKVWCPRWASGQTITLVLLFFIAFLLLFLFGVFQPFDELFHLIQKMGFTLYRCGRMGDGENWGKRKKKELERGE